MPRLGQGERRAIYHVSRGCIWSLVLILYDLGGGLGRSYSDMIGFLR